MDRVRFSLAILQLSNKKKGGDESNTMRTFAVMATLCAIVACVESIVYRPEQRAGVKMTWKRVEREKGSIDTVIDNPYESACYASTMDSEERDWKEKHSM